MAKNPMLKFVDRRPGYAGEARRRICAARISTRFTPSTRDDKAAEQASRCSQCGVPYCQTHCPLHNNIPDWLQADGRGAAARGL